MWKQRCGKDKKLREAPWSAVAAATALESLRGTGAGFFVARVSPPAGVNSSRVGTPALQRWEVGGNPRGCPRAATRAAPTTRFFHTFGAVPQRARGGAGRKSGPLLRNQRFHRPASALSGSANDWNRSSRITGWSLSETSGMKPFSIISSAAVWVIRTSAHGLVLDSPS